MPVFWKSMMKKSLFWEIGLIKKYSLINLKYPQKVLVNTLLKDNCWAGEYGRISF